MSVEVVGPDGKNYSFPDGTSKEAVVSYFKKQSGQQTKSGVPPFKPGVFEPRRRMQPPQEGILSKVGRGYSLGAASGMGIPETTDPLKILSSGGPLAALKHPIDTATGMFNRVGQKGTEAGHELIEGVKNPAQLPQHLANAVTKSVEGIPIVGSALEQFGPEIKKGILGKDPEQAAHGVGGLVGTAAMMGTGEEAATTKGPLTEMTATAQRAKAAKILNRLIQPTDKEIASQPGAALAEHVKPTLTSHSLRDFVIQKTDALTNELNRRVNAATAKGSKANVAQSVNALIDGPIRKASALMTQGNKALVDKLTDLKTEVNKYPLTQMTADQLLKLRRALKNQAFEKGDGYLALTSRRVSKLLSEELHQIDPKLDPVDRQIQGLIEAEKGARRRVEDLLRGKAPDPQEWFRATVSGSLGFAAIYSTLHNTVGAIGAAIAYPAIRMIQNAYKATPSATTRAYLRMKLADLLDSANQIGQRTGSGGGSAPPPPGPAAGAGAGVPPNPPTGGPAPGGGLLPNVGSPIGGPGTSPINMGGAIRVPNTGLPSTSSILALPETASPSSTGEAAAPAATEPAPAKPGKVDIADRQKAAWEVAVKSKKPIVPGKDPILEASQGTPVEAGAKPQRLRYSVVTTPTGNLRGTFVDGVLKKLQFEGSTTVYKNPSTMENILKRFNIDSQEFQKQSEGVQPEGIHGEGPEGRRAKGAERKAKERTQSLAERPGDTKVGGSVQVQEPTAKSSDPEALLMGIEAAQKAIPQVYGREAGRKMQAILTKAGVEKWPPSMTYDALIDLIESLQSGR